MVILRNRSTVFSSICSNLFPFQFRECLAVDIFNMPWSLSC